MWEEHKRQISKCNFRDRKKKKKIKGNQRKIFFSFNITIHRPFCQETSPSPLCSPKSRDSISPSRISCSGLRNKLPGLPVTIEKFAVVGDMLATEVTDVLGMSPAKFWYDIGGD